MITITKGELVAVGVIFFALFSLMAVIAITWDWPPLADPRGFVLPMLVGLMGYGLGYLERRK